mgnify:FL=1
MSLSSEDFASKKVEEEIIELSSEKMEVSEIPYEVQQDILFDAIVFGEVENNPAVRKMLEPQGQIESAE